MSSLALQAVKVDCFLGAQLGHQLGAYVLLRGISFTQLLGLPPSMVAKSKSKP